MTAENQNITVRPGNSRILEAHIKDGDSGLKELNLSGMELRWFLKAKPWDKVIVTKTTEDGGIEITSASEGQVEVRLTPSDTSKLKAGASYTHELQVIDSAGQVVTVTTGNVTPKN